MAQQDSIFQFHGFATHAWAEDSQKRDTHQRVLHVCTKLKEMGIHLWVDAERMEGNILDEMCHGIDQSATFVVFTTQAYVDKVSQTERPRENCKLEFQYGWQTRYDVGRVIVVMMEKNVKFRHLMLMCIGRELYIDMTEGDMPTDKSIAELGHKIIEKCNDLVVQPSMPKRLSLTDYASQSSVTSTSAPPIPPPQTQSQPSVTTMTSVTHSDTTSATSVVAPPILPPRTHSLVSTRGHTYTGFILSGTPARGVGSFDCSTGSAQGCHYTGSFEHNKMSGIGAMEFNNGDKYEGEWKSGLRNGKGTYSSPNGNRYEGEWKDDKQHGNGTFVWTHGESYVGDWKADTISGSGTYVWANNNRYEGDFIDGKPHGKGTMFWANGNTFHGIWRDGKRQGPGLLKLANGKSQKGSWKDDKFQQRRCVLL
eukprot:c12921_g3_i1.p1 GENE.c12921_g3_i1~~c12921_g3_i1.p1  ORF type:complete len:423 (-),score=68.20 c12921_g3_i1:342-1610(-)